MEQKFSCSHLAVDISPYGQDAAESNHQSQWKDWFIGQGDWKFRSRPGFDSWQFADQAEMYCWAEIENSVIC